MNGNDFKVIVVSDSMVGGRVFCNKTVKSTKSTKTMDHSLFGKVSGNQNNGPGHEKLASCKDSGKPH
jgi:hypothetical protein